MSNTNQDGVIEVMVAEQTEGKQAWRAIHTSKPGVRRTKVAAKACEDACRQYGADNVRIRVRQNGRGYCMEFMLGDILTNAAHPDDISTADGLIRFLVRNGQPSYGLATPRDVKWILALAVKAGEDVRASNKPLEVELPESVHALTKLILFYANLNSDKPDIRDVFKDRVDGLVGAIHKKVSEGGAITIDDMRMLVSLDNACWAYCLANESDALLSAEYDREDCPRFMSLLTDPFACYEGYRADREINPVTDPVGLRLVHAKMSLDIVRDGYAVHDEDAVESAEDVAAAIFAKVEASGAGSGNLVCDEQDAATLLDCLLMVSELVDVEVETPFLDRINNLKDGDVVAQLIHGWVATCACLRSMDMEAGSTPRP